MLPALVVLLSLPSGLSLLSGALLLPTLLIGALAARLLLPALLIGPLAALALAARLLSSLLLPSLLIAILRHSEISFEVGNFD
jgi:hypothetical protein